ncbi:hypothetical protein SAMN02982989_4703 [Xaviernesmea oryzae]|uniref:HAMP domain-containing protein n=1 Tax=Xaviernesmea oryzae TaxID=464029 RepID=A0A1X7CXX0_9HYPH|nr:methyl-accepting chemotaxis protein [Xaviernesmea oryzae]SMF04653.1 hypothetical protein SAMN02982989_4703 [Xaviernesmea oryzae]
MIRDRDRNELELRHMRTVVDALDGGLRRFAAGDLNAAVNTPFPAPFEGMRRDFNRGVGALGGTLDALVGDALVLRSESDTLRNAMNESAGKDAEDSDRLSRAAASIGLMSQHLREQKTRAQHAATIAYNARLDMRRPKEAVAAALKTIEAMGRKPDGPASKVDLETLSLGTEQIGRELDALCLYLDALNDQLGILSETAGDQAEMASSTSEDVKDVSRARHAAKLKTDMATLALDRMDRQIADIDRKAGRFVRVSAVAEPPHDPAPRDPGARGSHLRLVKS